MKITIIGAGASGTLASILIKRKYPYYDVVLLEQMEKPLKKLTATGNGKCNFGNTSSNYLDSYNNDFAKKIMKEYSFDKIITILHSLNIVETYNNNLVYPVSESAQTVINLLLEECNKLGIQILTSSKLIDYIKEKEGYFVITETYKYFTDKLVFACGGKSSPKLGSTGEIFKILQNKNYKICDLRPGLCSIRTKEKMQILDGIRVKCNVRVVDKIVLFNEKGEVLFRDHGLSGIVIFNASSIIARKYAHTSKIILDLIPDYSYEYLQSKYGTVPSLDFYKTFFNPKLVSYLSKITTNNPIKLVKNLAFNFDSLSGFENSQVTIGGVDISMIENDLSSKIEENIYFLGEMLDVDATCGGYNLMWAFATAIKLSENI